MNIEFWDPILLSLRIAVIASVVVMILGTFIGRLMAKSNFIGKMLIETILILPLVLPPSVVGFFLIVIFGTNSPIGDVIQDLFNGPIIFTWWAGVIASVVVAFPLMYQVTKAGFEHVDSGIEEAARVDGAGESSVFFYISLPLTIKYIITGFVLSFTRALGEFGATLMFAGNIPGKTQTVSTAIYVAIDSGNMEMAWQWVGSMILISASLLFFVQMLNKKGY
ncbi:molybdate ABC transporter permease subunit [Metabacillus bambusae]|uniref:Molybdenum transport system permease n=1 Tax=Metabacillus bambusae TaxID=2795218 RepID=A0ABS3N960_9BACI|nr:molybdate ABC transporter permease subunit [Metabacillus bambusae]MBO1514585.1 molybdate ABC transporter permease subunit [Metabacillus bambusae]